jgi:ribosomal protein S18 acetylase RimI-like enzyme
MDTRLDFEPATTGHGELLQQLVQRYFTHDHIPYDEQEVRAGLMQLLQDGNLGRAWIILKDGEAVGYAVLSFHFDHELGGRTGIMTDLYLEPAHRKQGLGTEAMHFIEAQAAGFGLRALELQVERSNFAAQALYRKMGFVTFDRMPMAKRLPR